MAGRVISKRVGDGAGGHLPIPDKEKDGATIRLGDGSKLGVHPVYVSNRLT